MNRVALLVEVLRHVAKRAAPGVSVGVNETGECWWLTERQRGKVLVGLEGLEGLE